MQVSAGKSIGVGRANRIRDRDAPELVVNAKKVQWLNWARPRRIHSARRTVNRDQRGRERPHTV
jgi:hypothetical protein